MPRAISSNNRYVAYSFLLFFLCSTATILAVEPTTAGLHELAIFDPGAHERGLPAVKFDNVPGGLTVEIPPAVHVHRYYYSGDKEFQGPIINGGPTIVVANHPKTGERMYINIVLPAGAPRIAHNKHGITYVYPNKRVEVKFQGFPFNPEKAIVKHQHGKGLGRNLQDAREHVAEVIHVKFADSQFVQSVKDVSSDGHEVLSGTGVALGDLSASGADTVKTLANMIPGVTYLKSLSEQQPNRDYDSEIRSAARKNVRADPDFVPTNR